ncbi:hypothetical protein [Pantoea phytobeneficialis]|uniref:Uncharacterized protein n=1 Tax=Pantoea phytobeneficialis TaxID=2052056 RepID=A0AAP9HAF1_9GAMM|nr:hypothetical protein [Pantoea phytobeneficialis]MDO6407468.1 hypothetical protein [Pantoea phytobeneficialis]QGR09484.1 hypothetical protein CTZ24_23715 [Pantoea phytobeneficialis]
MEVNYGSADVHLFIKPNTQLKHEGTGYIKRSINTDRTLHSNTKRQNSGKSNSYNWIKSDNYRNQYKMITDNLLRKIKKIVPARWAILEKRIQRGEKFHRVDIVSKLLSPFNFNAIEVLKQSKMTEVLNKIITSGVSDTTVRNALTQRMQQEMEMWEPANEAQIAGIKSFLETYKLINCDLTKLVLMQLNPQFSALNFSKEQLRFALRNLKESMTWTDIELSHMIANTIIPKNTELWYEKKKALFSDESVKSLDFSFRLQNSGCPSEITVEQLQKLLLRDGRRDMTCGLISLYATQSGIEFALYDHHTAILKKDEPNREPKVNSGPLSECNPNPSLLQIPETAPDRCPMLPSSLPVQTSVTEMKTQFCWFADPTTPLKPLMVENVPAMATFDFVSGQMVHTPVADAMQRSEDFSRQFLLDREE